MKDVDVHVFVLDQRRLWTCSLAWDDRFGAEGEDHGYRCTDRKASGTAVELDGSDDDASRCRPGTRCTGTARVEHGTCCASLLVLPSWEGLRSMALIERTSRRRRRSELLHQSRFLRNTQVNASYNGDLQSTFVTSRCCAFAELARQKQVVATGASPPSAVLPLCALSREGLLVQPSRICSPAVVTRSTDIPIRLATTARI